MIKNDYRAQAEDLAVFYFLQLTEAERTQFFDVFEEVYPSKNPAYASLKLKNSPNARFSKTDKHYVLYFILEFLPAIQQVELMRLEILTLIAHYKENESKKIMYYSTHDTTYDYICAEYVKKLTKLDEYNFQWFKVDFLDAQEIQETIEAVKYATLLECVQSLENVKADMDTVREYGKGFLDKLQYEDDYFGLKIYASFYPTSHQKIHLQPPELAGKFRDILNEYIAKTKIRLAELQAQNNAQALVLGRDLSVALTHYKNSKSFLKRVDLDLDLQARAGKIQLAIHTIPIEKSLQDVASGVSEMMRLLVISAVIIFVGLPLAALGILLTVWGFMNSPLFAGLGTLGLGWAVVNAFRKTFNTVGKRNETYSTESMEGLTLDFRDTYYQIMEERRPAPYLPNATAFTILEPYRTSALDYLFGSPIQLTPPEPIFESPTEPIVSVPEILDYVLENLWKIVKKEAIGETPFLHLPDDLARKYRNCDEIIKTAIGTRDVQNILPIPPKVIFQVMQYTMRLQLQYIYTQTKQIFDTAIENRLDMELYVKFFDVPCTLFRFYKDDGMNRVRGIYSAYDLYRIRHKQLLRRFAGLEKVPVIDLLDASEFEHWFEAQKNKYALKNMEKEQKQLTKQIRNLGENKRLNTSTLTPIFYENEEVLLYVF